LKIKLNDRLRLILVATTLVALIMVVAFIIPTRYIEKFQWKWVRFSLGTALIIWFSLKAYWKLRGSLVFWGIFATFLIGHCLGIGYFYYVGQGLSILEIGLVSGAEWGCMAVIIYRILHTAPELRQRNSQSPWTPTI
jgi:FtsH-binding integral membrane protein